MEFFNSDLHNFSPVFIFEIKKSSGLSHCPSRREDLGQSTFYWFGLVWLVLWIGFPLCRNCSKGPSLQS